MVTRWKVFPVLEALVAALRPPCLVVEGAELPDRASITDEQKPRDLLVTAIRRLDRCLEYEADVIERNRVRPEPPDRALREDRLPEWH